MTPTDDILLKLEAVSLLRRLKRYYRYKELEEYLGIDAPLLCKYVRGKLLPGRQRAKEIVKRALSLVDIKEELRKSLSPQVYDFFDLTNLSVAAPDLLLYIAIQAYKLYKGSEITKVLSLEGGGLIIASLIAALLNRCLVYAIRDHYIVDAIIEPYPATTGAASKYTKFIALPKRSINPSDKLLIVDDIMHTGSTIRILLKISRKAGSKVCGVFCLGVASEDVARKIEEEYGVKVMYLIEI